MNSSPASAHGPRRDFDEALVSPALDPMDGHSVDFPYEEVFRRLDGDDLPESDYERLGSAVGEVFRWAIQPGKAHANWETSIARRVIGAAWVLNPGYFEDSPSLSELARQLGISKASLSCHAAKARRKFKIKNRGQSHAWNFQPQKEVQR